MNRILLGLLGLIALTGILAAFWLLRGREAAEPPARPGADELRATSRWGEGPPAPVPGLSLQVNRTNELEVEQGTALILTVRADNPRAQIYASEQRWRIQVAAEQESGRASIKEHAPKAVVGVGVQSIILGTPKQGWDKLLRFHFRDQSGSLRPVEWPIRLVRVEPAVAELDASSVAEAVLALPPEGARALAPGRYELVARLEMAGPGSAGGWHGTVESEPVQLSVVAQAGTVGPTRQRMLVANAQYFLEVNDAAEASKLATEAAEADPESPEAWMLVGDAKLKAGDKEGALAGYDRAAVEYGKRPSRHEMPRVLMWKIKKLTQP